MYAQLGGVPRQSPQLYWSFPSGGKVEFRHLQYEDDKYAHQGKQYDLCGWDEGTHFTATQFWYLYSRLRSVSGKFKPCTRLTCNPDPDSFVRGLVDWWIDGDGFPITDRSGELRWFVRRAGELIWCDESEPGAQSITFVPSLLEDNAILRARDPDYERKLEALTEVDRDRLRRGNWNTRDTTHRVYRYDPLMNDAELPADYDPMRWVHVMGVDFGMVDDTAWCVFAAHPQRKESYLVEARKQNGLLPEQVADITAQLAEKYQPDSIVGDAGGLGKPYVMAHNSRYPRWPMTSADKTEKRAHIEMFNGDMRSGNIRIVVSSCGPWVSEVQSLQWADDSHEKEHKSYANHCADAALYAHRRLKSYLNTASAPVKAPQLRCMDPDLIEEEARQITDAASLPWWDR